MADIISEGHAQCTIDAMMRGEADDKSVQVAIASLLIAVTKLTDKVGEMEKSMWKKSDLTEFVDRRHREKCEDCPAKKYVDRIGAGSPADRKRSWIAELMGSETLKYFILVLILVWTVVTLSTSQEQSAAIMEKVQRTLSGGVSK